MSLTKREIDLVAKLGECMNDYQAIVYDDGSDYVFDSSNSSAVRDGDINEFAAALHVLQRTIMARSAEREHIGHFTRSPRQVEAG
jgi:hypothetical protein